MEGACVGGCEPVEAPRPHGVGGRGVAAAAVFAHRSRTVRLRALPRVNGAVHLEELVRCKMAAGMAVEIGGIVEKGAVALGCVGMVAPSKDGAQLVRGGRIG